jgi:CTP:molybdopterin cytidylyltransferase MocA
MKNPELVIMAAGMGSRYGGLKQIDTVDDAGHIIIDYSIYDAIRAGFKAVSARSGNIVVLGDIKARIG